VLCPGPRWGSFNVFPVTFLSWQEKGDRGNCRFLFNLQFAWKCHIFGWKSAILRKFKDKIKMLQLPVEKLQPLFLPFSNFQPLRRWVNRPTSPQSLHTRSPWRDMQVSRCGGFYDVVVVVVVVTMLSRRRLSRHPTRTYDDAFTYKSLLGFVSWSTALLCCAFLISRPRRFGACLRPNL